MWLYGLFVFMLASASRNIPLPLSERGGWRGLVLAYFGAVFCLWDVLFFLGIVPLFEGFAAPLSERMEAERPRARS